MARSGHASGMGGAEDPGREGKQRICDDQTQQSLLGIIRMSLQFMIQGESHVRVKRVLFIITLKESCFEACSKNYSKNLS